MAHSTELSTSEPDAPTRRSGTRNARRRPVPTRDGALGLRLRCLAALAALAALPVLAVLALALALAGSVLLAPAQPMVAVLLVLVALWLLVVTGEAANLVQVAHAATRAEPEGAALLTRASHPMLWLCIGEIADGMDVPEPDRVFVTATADVTMALRGGNRDLEIGLPLLGVLEVDELSALIAHELGHEIVGGTALLARTHATTRRADAVIARLPPGLVRTVGERWLRLVARLVRPATAMQELQADEWAAQLLGPLSTASALHRAVTVETAWHVLGEEYLPMVRAARLRPPLIPGLRELIQERGENLGRDSRRRVLQTSLFDAHPPRPERVAALLELAGADPAAVEHGQLDRPSAPGAHQLLTGGERTMAVLEREVVPDRPRRTQTPGRDVDEYVFPDASWEEVAAEAGRSEQERRLRILIAAASDAGIADLPSPPTLTGLLRVASEGELETLDLPPLDPRIRTERRRDGRLSLVRGYLSAMITVAVIRTGRARYDLDWGGPAELLRLDEEDVWVSWDPAPTIAQGTATPLAVDSLLRWLTHLGADLRAPLQQDTRAQDVRALGSLTRLRHDHDGTTSSATLVVWTTGLLIAPTPQPGGLLRFVPRVLRRRLPTPSASSDPVADLTLLAGDDPPTCPGTRWLDAHDVEAVQMHHLRAGLSLEITTAAGTETFASGDHTERQGNPAEDLTRLLGDRLRVAHSPL